MGYVFVTGGARSGKSALADRLGRATGKPVTFIATATAGDAEMAERIARHRAARPAEWSTVEEPLDLLGAVRESDPDSYLVVDCLTLWVSNLLGAGRSHEEVVASARAVADALRSRDGVVVSNEVGLGVVPATERGREFRDVLGAVNTVFAGCGERSLFMVAGRALELGPT
ncbi:MAG TPA: bifunctional adenosylcobinamide kinase/adenosylcobinamide-phosphate guanylyltransferase [Candidatus Dormibacteraeota bacterium]|nr:bifunctional adenosylcobinamide kinase/adenosylcobinamide-phosphate guanylyltransferase [Candidatus Dormibacteraeota bacterium]